MCRRLSEVVHNTALGHTVRQLEMDVPVLSNTRTLKAISCSTSEKTWRELRLQHASWCAIASSVHPPELVCAATRPDVLVRSDILKLLN